jgi:hypothetical protein
MCSGVLWYYYSTTLCTYDNAVPPRIAEISSKNVCLGGCRCGYSYVYYLTNLLGVVRIQVGIVSLIVECLYGLGRYRPSSHRTSMLPNVYTYASPAPDLFDPLNLLPYLYLRLYYAYACPFPVYLACSSATVDRHLVATGSDCLRLERSL